MSAREATPTPLCCPECGSSDVIKAPRGVYSDLVLFRRPPRLCLSCRLVFDAPGSLFLCVVAALFGAGVSALSLLEAISLLRSWRVGSSAPVLPGLVLDFICVPGGLWIAFVNARVTLMSLRSRRKAPGG